MPASPDRRAQLTAALGRVGVWSFALQTHHANAERDAVRAYEELGYRAIWIPESLASKEAFAHASILLGATDRAVIATGIANIYARDPMAMINGSRALTDAYPGRFLLGIGVSHAPSVKARGAAYERPIERMTAYLDAMDEAGYSAPLPAERPPVVLAALGPRMLELSAERTDGAHSYFVPVEHTRMARERLGDGGLLVVEQTAVLSSNAAAAREVARGFAARYLGMENYANNLRRIGWSDEDLADGGTDRLVDAVIVQGGAAAIVARVREQLDAGADHVCVQLRGADPTDLCSDGYAELRAALGELASER